MELLLIKMAMLSGLKEDEIRAVADSTNIKFAPQQHHSARSNFDENASGVMVVKNSQIANR